MTKNSEVKPPIAKKIPHNLETHGDIRVDNYFWMKDREHPKVIEYLNAENDYCDSKMEHTKNFQKDLFEEMKARIKEDDSSVPYKYNGYWYITKFEKGKDYPIHSRNKGSLEAKEEILFDCNEMAKDYDYFRLVGLNISPDNSKVVYGVDLESRRKYTIYVKDLNSGQILPTKIEIKKDEWLPVT